MIQWTPSSSLFSCLIFRSYHILSQHSYFQANYFSVLFLSLLLGWTEDKAIGRTRLTKFNKHACSVRTKRRPHVFFISVKTSSSIFFLYQIFLKSLSSFFKFVPLMYSVLPVSFLHFIICALEQLQLFWLLLFFPLAGTHYLFFNFLLNLFLLNSLMLPELYHRSRTGCCFLRYTHWCKGWNFTAFCLLILHTLITGVLSAPSFLIAINHITGVSQTSGPVPDLSIHALCQQGRKTSPVLQTRTWKGEAK